MVDALLPSPVDNKGNDLECLIWWSLLEKKYPLVFKTIVATLSIFLGPQVESSFSMMTDVIETKSGRLNIGTYEAIQTVKYSLMVSQVSFFSRLMGGGPDVSLNENILNVVANFSKWLSL